MVHFRKGEVAPPSCSHESGLNASDVENMTSQLVNANFLGRLDFNASGVRLHCEGTLPDMQIVVFACVCVSVCEGDSSSKISRM